MTIEEQVNHIITMDTTSDSALHDILFNDDKFAEVFSQPDISYLSDREQAIFYRNLHKVLTYLEYNV